MELIWWNWYDGIYRMEFISWKAITSEHVFMSLVKFLFCFEIKSNSVRFFTDIFDNFLSILIFFVNFCNYFLPTCSSTLIYFHQQPLWLAEIFIDIRYLGIMREFILGIWYDGQPSYRFKVAGSLTDIIYCRCVGGWFYTYRVARRIGWPVLRKCE